MCFAKIEIALKLTARVIVIAKLTVLWQCVGCGVRTGVNLASDLAGAQIDVCCRLA